VQLAEFSGGNRSDAVLLNKLVKLCLCVDAPRLCASLFQHRFGVLVLAKEDRSDDPRREHFNPSDSLSDTSDAHFQFSQANFLSQKANKAMMTAYFA